jgi:hypothetical protein
MRCEQCHVTERWKRIVNRGLSMRPSGVVNHASIFDPLASDACELGWSSHAGRSCRASVAAVAAAVRT